jgi:hypothetical protein
MSLSQWGAFGFGMVLGWFLYFVNRYRRGDVGLGDLTTVIGAIGGAAVTALFGAGGLRIGSVNGLLPLFPRVDHSRYRIREF